MRCIRKGSEKNNKAFSWRKKRFKNKDFQMTLPLKGKIVYVLSGSNIFQIQFSKEILLKTPNAQTMFNWDKEGLKRIPGSFSLGKHSICMYAYYILYTLNGFLILEFKTFCIFVSSCCCFPHFYSLNLDVSFKVNHCGSKMKKKQIQRTTINTGIQTTLTKTSPDEAFFAARTTAWRASECWIVY